MSKISDAMNNQVKSKTVNYDNLPEFKVALGSMARGAMMPAPHKDSIDSMANKSGLTHEDNSRNIDKAISKRVGR